MLTRALLIVAFGILVAGFGGSFFSVLKSTSLMPFGGGDSKPSSNAAIQYLPRDHESDRAPLILAAKSNDTRQPKNFLKAVANQIQLYKQELVSRTPLRSDVKTQSSAAIIGIQKSADKKSKHAFRSALDESAALLPLGSRRVSASKASDVAEPSILVVYGPIHVSDDAIVSVLGQEFDITALGMDPFELATLAGRSAYLEAELSADIYSATRLEVFDEFAVPGATPVYVQGEVAEIKSELGLMQIAGLEIDITGLSEDVLAGNSFAVPGIQPLPGGVILSQENTPFDANLIAALSTSEVASISGSSGRSISGSSGRSISGSSGRSISGSSGRSISGSSGRSISGSSGRSISGSSGRSISGSSGRSISGSSGRSISGSSGRSISGSSGRSISGSSGR